MSETRQTYADLKDELLLTREQIAARVKEMGRQITQDFQLSLIHISEPTRPY